MKRVGSLVLAGAALAAFTSVAAATPNVNGAIVLERLYNDCPISTVVSTNSYPASIQITDSWNGLCVGFANGHAWNFSADGGATSANLGNNGNYKFTSTVVLNATSGTINLAPATGALGTSNLVLPIASDTLVGKATTDTLTNKSKFWKTMRRSILRLSLERARTLRSCGLSTFCLSIVFAAAHQIFTSSRTKKISASGFALTVFFTT